MPSITSLLLALLLSNYYVVCYLPSCKSSSECSPNAKCIYNRCISDTKPCVNNTLCNDGYVCASGACILKLDFSSGLLPNGSYFNPAPFLTEHKNLEKNMTSLHQCVILKHLFYATHGKFWTLHDNAASYLTLSDFDDCCGLFKYGVYCDAAKFKNITYLDWSNRNLTQHWPTWWTSLTSLEYLNLGHNPNLRMLPPDKHELEGLSDFKFFYPSAFLGSGFPKWIFKLPNLSSLSLYLQNLNLTGYLPNPLPRLYLMDIHGNPNLQGIIDSKYLFLDSNNTKTCISPFSLVRSLNHNFKTPHRLLDFTSSILPRPSQYTGRLCETKDLFWHHRMHWITLIVFTLISGFLIAFRKNLRILFPNLVWSFWSFSLEFSFLVYLVEHFTWPAVETVCLFMVGLLSVFVSRLFIFAILWKVSFFERTLCALEFTFSFWFFFRPLTNSDSMNIQKFHLSRGIYTQIGLKNGLQLFLSLHCFFSEEYWNLAVLLLWLVNSINLAKDLLLLVWWNFIYNDRARAKEENIIV